MTNYNIFFVWYVRSILIKLSGLQVLQKTHSTGTLESSKVERFTEAHLQLQAQPQAS